MYVLQKNLIINKNKRFFYLLVYMNKKLNCVSYAPPPFHSYIVSVNPLCVPAESICRAGTISPVQWQFGWRGLFLSQHPRWQLSGGAIQWCVIVYLGLLLSISALIVDTFRLCQFGYTTLIKLLVAKTIIKYSSLVPETLQFYIYM